MKASDNNGGIISVFWTTLGGIYAQHTGRVGQVGIVTGVKLTAQLPAEFSLSQNYPNPFNSTTRICFQISRRAQMILKVYDIVGREVATLLDEVKQAGEHEVEWNASDQPSGVYFCRFASGKFTDVKKMILMK
jgi:hypothetical protein